MSDGLWVMLSRVNRIEDGRAYAAVGGGCEEQRLVVKFYK